MFSVSESYERMKKISISHMKAPLPLGVNPSMIASNVALAEAAKMASVSLPAAMTAVLPNQQQHSDFESGNESDGQQDGHDDRDDDFDRDDGDMDHDFRRRNDDDEDEDNGDNDDDDDDADAFDRMQRRVEEMEAMDESTDWGS